MLTLVVLFVGFGVVLTLVPGIEFSASPAGVVAFALFPIEIIVK